MFADLHIHSQHSDGALSSSEIIEKARSQDITLISVCDHNSIDFYAEVENMHNLGDMKIIRGVEISSVLDGAEYHILAYGFDIQNKSLIDLLRHNRNVNVDMGNCLIENMTADYPVVSLEEFSVYERNRRNGGWESIDYLMSKGIVTDWAKYTELVRKYASPLKKNFLSPKEVINIVHNAGGYAVLAHLCHHVKPDVMDYENKAVRFFDMGIDGFECYYPSCPSELTEYLVAFCHERDLMITAGSDDHGGFIGAPSDEYYIGAVKIKIEQLELRRLM